METKEVKEFIVGTEKFLDGLKMLIEFQEGVYAKYENESASDALKIMNFNSLVAISSLDLHIILKHFDAVEHLSEKRFFVKSASLIIYESINTYRQYGKELMELATHDKELSKSISNDIKVFNGTYKLRLTRNITAAHIDKDFKTYYDIVSNFDMDKSRLMILEYLNILTKMMTICTNFIKHRKPPKSIKDLDVTLEDIRTIIKEKYSS